MPSINSARYAQRIIQTESHESPSFLRKVHRLDPPISGLPSHALVIDISGQGRWPNWILRINHLYMPFEVSKPATMVQAMYKLAACSKYKFS